MMKGKNSLLASALVVAIIAGGISPSLMAASLFYDLRVASQPSNSFDCNVIGAEKVVGCTGVSGYGKNASIQEGTTTAPFTASMSASSSTSHGATGRATLSASVLSNGKLISARTQSTGSTVDLGIGTNTQSYSSVDLRLSERIFVHISPSVMGEVSGTFNMPYDGMVQTYAMHNNAPSPNQNGVFTGSISLQVSDQQRGLFGQGSTTLVGSLSPLDVDGVVSTGSVVIRPSFSSATLIPIDIYFSVAIGQFTSYFQENDFLNTFGLSVVLPDGVTASSQSGLLDSFLAPVPEPKTFLMLLVGVGCLLASRRRLGEKGVRAPWHYLKPAFARASTILARAALRGTVSHA